MGRQWMTADRTTLVVVSGALVLGLAGCGSGDANPGTTLPPLTTASVGTSASPTVPPETMTTSAALSSDGSVTPEISTGLPTTSPSSSSSASIPPDFTPEQAAMAAEALSVLDSGWAVVQKMYADPAADVTAELNSYTADPLRTQAQQGAAKFAAAGEHRDGTNTIEPSVVSIDGDGQPGTIVQIDVCVDSSSSVIRDAAGAEIRRTDPQLVRTMFRATVYKFDQGWLFDSFAPASTFTPC